MKKHLAHIAALAIAVGIGWFSHSAVAEPQVASCTIGPGIAIKGDAQVTCVQTAHDRGVPRNAAAFNTSTDQVAALAAQATGRITAQEFLLAPGAAKAHDRCGTDGLIARDHESGAVLFCQGEVWVPMDSARSNVASD